MIIEEGSKVHIVHRALFDKSTRRHFFGEIVEADGALCRIEGFAFIFDVKSETYKKRPEKRTTIVDLGSSGFIVNIVDSSVDINSVTYRYVRDVGLVITDDKNFVLNINEFGSKN
jgi:hypothetical protein